MKKLDLSQFYGTENWYRHPLTGLLYTDGVRYVAEEAGAYWLIDQILLAQKSEEHKVLRTDPMLKDIQFWVLAVARDSSAKLTCVADRGMEPAVTIDIPWTDFPEEMIDLWFENGVLMLPSER